MTAELFEAQINRLQEKLMLLQQEKVEAEFAYFNIVNSPSWRLTAPLRWANKLIKNLRAWLRLQKIKLQRRHPHSSAVLLVSHDEMLISAQVSEIIAQVNNGMRKILIECTNAYE